MEQVFSNMNTIKIMFQKKKMKDDILIHRLILYIDLQGTLLLNLIQINRR